MKLAAYAAAFVACLPTNAAFAAPIAKPETVVIRSSCLISTPPQPPAADGSPPKAALFPALAAILLPIVIELGIDAVSSELKKVRSVTATGSNYFYLYRKGVGTPFPDPQFPPCVTILTGDLGVVPVTEVFDVKGAAAVTDTEQSLLDRLAANGITLPPGKLQSAIEVKVQPSADGTAFRYVPAYARVFRMMPGGGNAKEQGLVLNLSLTGAGASPNGTVYSLAPIQLGTVKAGWGMTDDDMANATTGNLLMPGLSEQAARAYVQNLMGNGQITSFMPVMLKAEVVQTQKPSDAAVIVANLLDKAKPKLSEAAAAEIKKLDPFTSSQAVADADIAVKAAEVELADAKAANSQPKIALAEAKLAKARAALANIAPAGAR